MGSGDARLKDWQRRIIDAARAHATAVRMARRAMYMGKGDIGQLMRAEDKAWDKVLDAVYTDPEEAA